MCMQLHAGVSQTLAASRQRYWITRGQSAVKNVVRQCGSCQRSTDRPYKPKMGELPTERGKIAKGMITWSVRSLILWSWPDLHDGPMVNQGDCLEQNYGTSASYHLKRGSTVAGSVL
ncbi:hypothetical protein T08_1947 [Trichinella sp. T8]|nr:hypothetical protein T08_1947 [Trichinella sp. T8]